MAEIQGAHWWYEGRRRILREILRGLDLPAGATVLEAGCGTGANLGMLAEFGEVSAFEPDELARACAEQASAVVPLLGRLPDGIPFDGPFDLVAALDVIEHVEDDLGACAALREVTRPGGYALITVPAFPWLWSEHDVANHHFRRYRRKQLADLLGRAGYRDVWTNHFNAFLLPAVAGVRAVHNLSRKPGARDDTMPRSALVNRTLTAVFASERRLVTRVRVPAGVSLVAVAQR